MRISHPLHLLVFTMAILIAGQQSAAQKAGRAGRLAVSKMEKWVSPVGEGTLPERFVIDSLKVDEEKREINIWFPVAASYNPIREETVTGLNSSVRSALGRKFAGYRINMISNGLSLESLVPNYFRNVMPDDGDRIMPAAEAPAGLIRRVNAVSPSRGLEGRHIALWHSHGYYFDMPLDRWEWQRAKLFGSVEDISVMAYVLPYLTPMLENAGAVVLLPRERDIQVNEVIVDNDISTGASGFVLQIPGEPEKAGKGFLLKDTLFNGDNPFMAGTSLKISSGSALYVPEIPERGWYGVTVSYPRVPGYKGKAMVRVTHTGGVSEFIVDQSIGGVRGYGSDHSSSVQELIP